MKFWIARDQDGYLYLYDKKPIREEDCFNSNINSKYNTLLHSSYFPEVTFENSPQEVKLILVSEKISESIVNEFMNILNFTYDKTEKCMATKIYNTDLTSLKNIIESKLCDYER